MHKARIGITVALGALCLQLVAAVALACQLPPGSQVPCHMTPEAPVVAKADPFTVYVTVVNFPTTAPFPPPFFDDELFNVFVSGELGTGGRKCNLLPGIPGYTDASPGAYSVELDEAWSPFADEPTQETAAITMTPISPGDYYGFWMQATTNNPPLGSGRFCSAELCVQAFDDPRVDSGPYGLFVEPVKAGDAGGVLPFEIRVLRNNYPAGVPLTVRVNATNSSDPLDIFPISPPSLATTGYTVLGDDEIVAFECHLHYPCLVGMDNLYHVTIHDGATLLWDSTWYSADGIGRAIVNRSPMARQELVAIDDAGGDGRLGTGEEGTIHLRLFARNPYFAADLVGAALETAIPTGLTVDSFDFHFYDNPMDAYTPTPAELAAAGSETIGTTFRVDVAAIDPRFATAPFTPPTMFVDMFVVELVLRTPVGGFPTPTDLVFPGVTVSGTAGGVPKLETSGPLTVSVLAATPPHPVRNLLCLRSGADVQLIWNDSVVDPLHGIATTYRVHRSLVAPNSDWVGIIDVADTAAATEQHIDLGAVAETSPFSATHYYFISGWNADGTSGAP